ncbi:restriction endonuclease subunit S [Aliarcobacter cryaerophilus]|uniref:restriction endonuclease subunit S n=1 Tax=Aliarcobacter cryaerophilus TaxID=28198 RepID=UPI0021B5BDFD|nr:restriction endonuclease subunit S [Aliarcobacter cryaerophilus]MCT7486190.1 restriction endonuclease subunit S [Aliarcobacter cryaerophilus]MCT7490253.1 restriction endonuclease subunit S [Aliarcobacter cryaerophilus]
MSEIIKIPEGWESVELEKLLEYEQPTKYLVTKANYHDSFKTPVLTAGKTFILGYTDEKYGIFNHELPVIIFDDFTTASKFVNFPFKAKSSAMKMLKIKDKTIDIKIVYELMQKLNFKPEEHKRHWISTYSKLKINLPKKEKEQQKISEILSEVDNAISKTEELFEKNKRIKTSLVQDLLNYGVDENGKVRNPQTHIFKPSELGDIPVEWDSKVLKQVCKVRQGLQIAIKQRFKESGENRYVYITVQYLNNKESNEEFIQSPDEDLICNKDDILFTRTGNTGQIITGVHGVFHNNFFRVDIYKDILEKDFMVYFLNYEVTQQKIKDLASTTTIPDLKHSDFYSLSIKFPKSKNEQQKITQILSSQDEKIEVIKNKLNKLKLLKTSLMQDLLSGKVRVTKLMEENS